MPRRLALASAIALAASGCAGDGPSFHAEGYEVVSTSPQLRANGSVSWAQGNNWLPDIVDPPDAVDYLPPFCDAGASSTTVSADQSEVTVDWSGCTIGFKTAVGTFTYAGDGAYEGLIDLTVGSVTTPIGMYLRLEPRVYE